MGILRTFDRRRQPRKPLDLFLMVWGVDTQGERFLLEAHARDISLSGALLSGLDADLKSGRRHRNSLRKEEGWLSRSLGSVRTRWETRCKRQSTGWTPMLARGWIC
jgi:hypothetical protein